MTYKNSKVTFFDFRGTGINETDNQNHNFNITNIGICKYANNSPLYALSTTKPYQSAWDNAYRYIYNAAVTTLP